MSYIVALGLFIPLIGFLLLMCTAHVIGRLATGIIACSTVFISLICFITTFLLSSNRGIEVVRVTFFSWIPVDGINADFSLCVDNLSLLMTFIITGIGFLIHVYSTAYMEHEKDFARYFACLNFFIFSMLLLVLSSNTLLLFVGWEGVGLASYLLIGFWYHRPKAAKAATKAFVVNRVGDFGFLLALLLTFHVFGTSEISVICEQAGNGIVVGASVLTAITLLYFVGAIGKSAQLPLHVWLADAMEGPTPVSALIHAATMVTAGVYLVVRLHPLFLLTPEVLNCIGIIGAITCLFAALCAVGQTELKRVLAYSTVSQLGLMFLACSIGAFYTAMFHLMMHAFVKALLFLSAGNVIHMMHGNGDMGKMGGLSKKLPKTRILFLIGVLALSGVPPFAAFFSKDLILEQEYLIGFKVLFYIAFFASVLTAFYLMRAYCLTFLGKTRSDPKEFQTLKEAPKAMLFPLFILVFFAIFGGFLGFACYEKPVLEDFLAGLGLTNSEKEFGLDSIMIPHTYWILCCSIFSLVLSAVLYTKFRDRLGGTFTLLRRSFFIDEIYERVIVSPLAGVGQLINRVLEPKCFEGFLRLNVGAVQRAASQLQLFQSGQIRSYVAWMALGAVLLVLYFNIEGFSWLT